MYMHMYMHVDTVSDSCPITEERSMGNLLRECSGRAGTGGGETSTAHLWGERESVCEGVCA